MANRTRPEKCPHCEQPVRGGRDTTIVHGTETGYGTSPSGKTYKKQVPFATRWHNRCLADFQALNAESRDRALAQDRADMYRGMLDAGVAAEKIEAGMRRAGHTWEAIAAAREEASR
jgi:hypothetical protein